MKKIILYIIAITLILLGLISLFLSTSVIFDLFAIREKEGNYVLFVVWSNFISGIIYLFASYGLIFKKKWTTFILACSTLILFAAFIGLQLHIHAGGMYEDKTINAMIFRFSLTLLATIISYLFITKHKK